MKVLITSGGTREMIDGVRCITNISSGRLGSIILNKFLDEELKKFEKKSTLDSWKTDNEYIFVRTKGSELPDLLSRADLVPLWLENRSLIQFFEVTNVESVMETMEKLVPQVDVVIHPMAISDFAFSPIKTKLKSNDPEAFIESMRERIYRTPKILSYIKEWNPKCFLISFKFEDGVSHAELIEAAHESMEKNNCDIVIANEKGEMNRLGFHRAYFLNKGEGCFSVDGKDDIARHIVELVKLNIRIKG